jgi:hypothetical protein
MHKKTSREDWLRDIQASQRNTVFPDTAANEARFWRNIGKQPFNLTTKIGLALLALLGWGFLARVLVASFQEGVLLSLLLAFVLVWGPIFGTIAWATRRTLRRNDEEDRHHRDTPSQRRHH